MVSYFHRELLANFDAAILFCSRHNNVTSIQDNYSNLRIMLKSSDSYFLKNLRNAVSVLNRDVNEYLSTLLSLSHIDHRLKFSSNSSSLQILSDDTALNKNAKKHAQ